jgi:phosphatidylserine/phosphatidylglycerophosphate/cardiolipin synthase-like enzyme
MTAMDWLMLATGFTGALTLAHLARVVWRRLVEPPSVAAHFSPRGGCTDVVLAALQAARHEVLVLAYSFTSRPIAEALVEAHRRGVKVEVVLDKSNETEDHTDMHFLAENGLAPLIDHEHAIAHNKVMLIDRRVLLTGSFNFTHQAEHENAENLLVLAGHADLIRAYHDNFTHHKEHARAAEVKRAVLHRHAA